MTSIGVRELRRDASRWLARVQAGESILVTDRGRPIARMVPVEEPRGYAAPTAEGRIAPGRGRTLAGVLGELDSELPCVIGESVSATLAAMRAQER